MLSIMIRNYVAIFLSCGIISSTALSQHPDTAITNWLIAELNGFTGFTCTRTSTPNTDNAFLVEHPLHYDSGVICEVIEGDIQLTTGVNPLTYDVAEFLDSYDYAQDGFLSLYDEELPWLYGVQADFRIFFTTYFNFQDFHDPLVSVKYLIHLLYNLNESLFFSQAHWPTTTFFEIGNCISGQREIRRQMLNDSDATSRKLGRYFFPFTWCDNINNAMNSENGISRSLSKKHKDDFWKPIVQQSFPLWPEEVLSAFTPSDEIIETAFLSRCREDFSTFPEYQNYSKAQMDSWCLCGLEYLQSNEDVDAVDLTTRGGIAVEEIIVHCADYIADKDSRSVEKAKLECASNQLDVPVLSGIDGVNRLKVEVGGKSVYMIMDTGASFTVLASDWLGTAAISNSLRYQGENVNLILADGNTVQSKLYILDYIGIGACKVRDLEVVVIDNGVELAGQNVGGMNLLGQNFFRLFKSVEFKASESVLSLEW